MQRRYGIRLSRQQVVIAFLVILFLVYVGVSKHTVNQPIQEGLPASTLAPDAIQQQVAEAVGTTVGLQELFVSQLTDHTYMVHATVDGTYTSDQPMGKNEMNALGIQFMNKVYALHLPIESAELYIVQNGRMAFGMGVGQKYKDVVTSVQVSSGGDQQTAAVQTIQKINNQDEQDPSQLAWIETAPEFAN